MKKEDILIEPQEQKRVLVLNRIQAGQLSAAQAAELLHLSERHVRRILAAERSEGVATIAHGNRGRKPARTMSSEVREQVIRLARTTYRGSSQSHLRDLLEEREGINASKGCSSLLFSCVSQLAYLR